MSNLPPDHRAVLRGLRLVSWGVTASCVGWIALLVDVFMRVNDRTFSPALVAVLGGWQPLDVQHLSVAHRLHAAGLGLVLLGMILGLLGKLSFLGAAEDAPTRRLLLSSLAMDIAGVLVAALAFTRVPEQFLGVLGLGSRVRPVRAAIVVGLLSRLAWAAGAALLLTFLERLSAYLKRVPQENHAIAALRTVWTAFCVFAVGQVLVLVGTIPEGTGREFFLALQRVTFGSALTALAGAIALVCAISVLVLARKLRLALLASSAPRATVVV